ncbi:Saccharopine dehydrogenase (NADP(+), L-glutamate-forming) [Aminomonas paucivorans DSM 12260]|uniref:Saccharopine dehydrogenase (NADP(+), L-glutamate-forming) n=1 Tax=Aminomonas paucivorans DSM 12260 TaxID=584708 RepID=E3D063_9BACT|nr:saccharopine dehydrogenase C-terminal domain-containing protein [Aminomonas paucivorans]EFQ24736.1 Saccharopine dehydrogenase (NADP(+), L-glutamate-forming) [Aminomonas paucivorans DSM 12260]
MKNVLVFGAGRVCGPCVRYLAAREGVDVTVVDAVQENLDRVLEGTRGKGIRADAASRMGELLERERPQVAIGLLPPRFLVPLAEQCVKHRVHLVAPSYAKEELRALDGPAREAGVTLLAELGLDPGIDHLSAARTVSRIHHMGGRVDAFWSVCGALPAPESNDNPLGYKLSWAPGSLVGASRRDARILEDGAERLLPDGETFRRVGLTEIRGLGWFEHYANADSLPYVKLYDMPEVRNVYRGTLRYPGWCETVCALRELGFFDLERVDFRGRTFPSLLRERMGISSSACLKTKVLERIGARPHHAVALRLEWLGVFEDTPLPLEEGTMQDLTAAQYEQRLPFLPGERDLVAMEHRYEATFPATGRRFRFTSTLVDRGTVGSPEGTSIARTTGLPPAMGARMLLEGRVRRAGLVVPTTPDLYEPLLEELEGHGIRFREREELLD